MNHKLAFRIQAAIPGRTLPLTALKVAIDALIWGCASRPLSSLHVIPRLALHPARRDGLHIFLHWGKPGGTDSVSFLIGGNPQARLAVSAPKLRLLSSPVLLGIREGYIAGR